ncbi:phosphopentomutase [Pikeienuella piscinae]|uniref:Phosphopentomutase n=1 Tax=Pikeienuella piscinae TaxID=2748098 RepID=A0A7L5BX36_9RHOB|nr:phosphopentomutase [Pikeienuella piscinae]QIE54806.1 phosphopentomutase [Pikeienuella piscinae]
MNRVFLLVMDSVGIGGAPDAADFGDEGADTLGHIAAACADARADEGREGPLNLPHLDALGLGAAARAATGRTPPGLGGSGGAWAAAREWSRGKDTPSGHWEIAGAPVDFDWGYFSTEPPVFPPDLIAALCARADLPGALGLAHSNGVEIIRAHGEEHLATGRPIIYTSADSVMQIAAHEKRFGLERLYRTCEIARELCDPLNIGRVIARPFLGDGATGFRRTPNRRDYASPPHRETLCDRVAASGGRVIGVGKIADIFAHRAISETRKGPDDMALFDETLAAMDNAADGDLVFANFVEFDSLYGHLRDVAGYARALEAFDARLPEAFRRLRPGDLLIITADHGNDPTWRGTDHTRERTPALFAAPGAALRAPEFCDFADIGATAAAWLGLGPSAYGRSLF